MARGRCGRPIGRACSDQPEQPAAPLRLVDPALQRTFGLPGEQPPLAAHTLAGAHRGTAAQHRDMPQGGGGDEARLGVEFEVQLAALVPANGSKP